MGGSNHIGRNGCRKKTNILSIYGPENLCALNEAAAESGHSLLLPDNPNSICFQAVADVFETDFNLYQNFSRGFFMHFHLPVLLVQIYPSGYLEDACCCRKASKHYKPVWEKTLKPINAFLQNYDLALNTMHDAGLSDSTLFAGWTTSYENTCYLDYIDFTLKTGILFPTGKRRNPDQVFSIPVWL